MANHAASEAGTPPGLAYKPRGMIDDGALLRQYLEERSEEAFTELVRRHLSVVYFAALRRVGGDRHLADDVAQSVFADLAKKAATLKDRPVLVGWLYTSTRFAAAQAVRTEQRRRTHEQEAQTMQELHSTPEANWEQLRPVIDGAMDDLNEQEREIVLLRFFERLPLAEVGARFSISTDAARMRVDRALDKLRGLLARRGVASTSTALGAVVATQSGLAAPAGLVAQIAGSVLHRSGAAAAATFGLGKIVGGLVLGGCAVGLVVYETGRLRPAPAGPDPEVVAESVGKVSDPAIGGLTAAPVPAALPSAAAAATGLAPGRNRLQPAVGARAGPPQGGSGHSMRLPEETPGSSWGSRRRSIQSTPRAGRRCWPRTWGRSARRAASASRPRARPSAAATRGKSTPSLPSSLLRRTARPAPRSMAPNRAAWTPRGRGVPAAADAPRR